MNQNYFYYIFFITLLVFFTSSYAQTTGDKSHEVEKGETIFGISRAYNIPLQSLLEANPKYQTEVLKEGDVLIIPSNFTSSSVTPPNSVSSSTNSDGQIIHLVQAGETKFGLSKRYNISIAQLERDNPHIVSMLQIGHQVVINASPNTLNTSNSEGLYVVKPGETLWGLAKRYSITVDQLREANRDLLQGVLRSGQNLRIPNSQAVREEEVNVYIVQKGDTKFGLSRKNGISVQEFERLNPHTVSMLQIGHRVVFGSSTVSTSQTSQVVQIPQETKLAEPSVVTSSESKPGHYRYEIQPKETLFSLARKAGISQESLLELNPEMSSSGVKAGMLIWMPLQQQTTQTTVTTPSTDVAATQQTQQNQQVVAQTSISNNTQANFSALSSESNSFEDLTTKINKQKTLKVAFIFSQETESRSALQVNNEIPFYQGVMWALDSLKKWNVKVEPIFLSTDAKNYKNNGWRRSFKSADLVIGPFNENSLNDLATFSQAQSQTLHIPISSSQILKGQLVYSYPSDFHQLHALLDFLNKKKGNIVIVNDGLDDNTTPFIREHFPSAKFAPMDSRGNINFERLNVAFSKNQTNYVVLTTQKTGAIIATTNYLLNQMGNYTIQLAVANEKLIPNPQDVSEMRLKILKLIVPKVVVKDVQKNSKVATEFQKKYGTALNTSVYQAFDQTFDLILRYNVFDSFENGTKTSSSQQAMNFEYTQSLGGFWNRAIQIVQMDAN